jgi:hypothetical protein
MKRQSAFNLFMISLCIIWLLMNSIPVSADVAPPAQPPGSDPEATQQTMVQMAGEQVILEIQDLGLPSEAHWGDCTTRAHVTASFMMINQGESTETMAVRFPLMDPQGQGNGFGDWPLITDFTLKINGVSASTFLQTSANPWNKYDLEAPPIPWAAFNVTFPPGETVLLEGEYTINAMGYLPIEGYYYLLETGAGWYGQIGKGDIILRMPYPVTAQNVFLDDPEKVFSDKTYFSGNDYIIHFENLEPTHNNNIYFRIVSPFAWEKVILAREKYTNSTPVDKTKTSIELAKALYYVFGESKNIRYDIGANEMVLEALKVLNQAIELAPDNYEAHYVFELILYDLAYFNNAHFDAETIQRYKSELGYLEDNIAAGKDMDIPDLDYDLSFFEEFDVNIINNMVPDPNSIFSSLSTRATSTPTVFPEATQSSPTEKQISLTPTNEEMAINPTQKQPLISMKCGKIPLSAMILIVIFFLRKRKSY